jgi:alkanesulfonate monooxygenase SsuD/methylene tetrahydromethanopterin reductase-like flavin-dependent oxidoreductase (luciferase family)
MIVMELGIYAFGDIGLDPNSGETMSVSQRLEGVINLGIAAEKLGLDVVAIGEQHGKNFAISAPEVVLGALARETSKVRLTTAATVLSTADPVRVFQQLATVDQLSGGRAEIVVGKGASVDSFALFGIDGENHDDVFGEKLELLLELRANNPISWQGSVRPDIDDRFLVPRPEQDCMPIWVANGGSEPSLTIAGAHGLPIFLSVFQPVESLAARLPIYEAAAAQAGVNPASLKVATGSHLYVAKSSQAARVDFFPYYAGYWQNNSAKFVSGFPQGTFDDWVAEDGPMLIGSPQQIIDKLMKHHEQLNVSRFIGQIDVGSMPDGMAQDSLELFATEVAPVIRRETA